jgi:hypothetical protein
MLCTWKPGDVISAQHLNQMTSAINANTAGVTELNTLLNDKGSSSITGSGGIDMGSFTSSGLEPCAACLNRGYIKTGWEYTNAGESKKGIFVMTSGTENARDNSYPTKSNEICLSSQISGLADYDIILTTQTSCYGRVINQCYSLISPNSPHPDNMLWQGPAGSSSSNNFYMFTRRVGKIVTDPTRPINSGDSGSAGHYNKVLDTNDLVMPILPARTEGDVDGPCTQSFSLLNGYIDNSFLIKNINNGGGLNLKNTNTNLTVASGVEFYKGTSCPDCNGGINTTFDATAHVVPQCFDVTIACIPIKEKRYVYCKATYSWVEQEDLPCGGAGSGVQKEEKSIKIQAKTLNNNNWQIGWTSSGEIIIPVKEFTPADDVDYKAGRGICITTKTGENDSSDIETVICNTMVIEGGNGIKVDCTETGYKVSLTNNPGGINLIAGTGICITSQTGEGGTCYTITNTAVHEAIVVDAGDGICVVQTGNKYTVSLASCSSGSQPGGSSGYIFDSTWFCVNGSNVTLNEAKINAVASTAAMNISSQITSTATATIDTWTDDTGYAGYSGEIIAEINTTSGCTATANIKSVST